MKKICYVSIRGSIVYDGMGSNTIDSLCEICKNWIEGIYKLLMSEYYLPINIGNPDEISLKEFVLEVLSLNNNKSKITYKPLPINDPKKRKPDISKAKSILGWQPKVKRKKGLKYTYDYFKSFPKKEWNKLPKDF
jgi:dTDP-glucose 4,6-dehydratase